MSLPRNLSFLAQGANTTGYLANTQLAGIINSSQIGSISNTQITGLITSGQIATVANTQITGTLTTTQGGTGLTSFAAGTNYVAPSTSTTFTATQIFTGSSTSEAIKLTNITEVSYINTNPITANTTMYVSGGAVQYWTANAASNTTVNITWSSGTTLNTAMSVGDSLSVAMLFTNGANTFLPTVYQIDGAAVTPKWQANTIPTSGNASGVDIYSISVIKTAATPTYTVLASQTQFK
jgi:hypothetical protein